MHRPSTEDVFSSEFLLLVYRKHAGMGKLKQTRNQLSLILSQLCYIVKIMFSKVYFKFIPWSKVSVVKVQNWHAKTRYQNEVTEDKLHTEPTWGCYLHEQTPRCSLLLRAAPWARPSSLVIRCPSARPPRCLGELIADTLPMWDGRKREEEELENSWIPVKTGKSLGEYCCRLNRLSLGSVNN